MEDSQLLEQRMERCRTFASEQSARLVNSPHNTNVGFERIRLKLEKFRLLGKSESGRHLAVNALLKNASGSKDLPW